MTKNELLEQLRLAKVDVQAAIDDAECDDIENAQAFARMARERLQRVEEAAADTIA